jgi:hypothetical protein
MDEDGMGFLRIYEWENLWLYIRGSIGPLRYGGFRANIELGDKRKERTPNEKVSALLTSLMCKQTVQPERHIAEMHSEYETIHASPYPL